MADYLVSGSIHRETAFDLENQGYTGSDLTARVDQLISESLFRDRASQIPVTLSGGEQQLLAITVALQQPHSFLLGQHCLDFLSQENLDLVQQQLTAHGKRMLEITYRSGNTTREETIWRFTGEQLVPLNDRDPMPVRTDGEGMMAQWQLHAEGIEKCFDGSPFVLRIPHLKIDHVRCLGIYGENGSGKTTLADCLTNISSYSGKLEIRIPGVSEPRPGYLIQHMGAHTHGLSTGEILQKFTARGRLSLAQADRLQVLLGTAAGYQDLVEQDARIGYRLVIIAALFAGDYDLVVLDEPTYGLPASPVAEFLDWIRDHIAAKPLAIISHDYNFLSLFCDKIIHLKEGVVDESCI